MKKLFFALLAAAFVLTACNTTETAPVTVENSPIHYTLGTIPDGAEYLTVCRVKGSGSYKIKSDEVLRKYAAEELENYCCYIPRGDKAEIVDATPEGDFVFDDSGLRLVYSDGREVDLPFESANLSRLTIVRDEISGEISGVVKVDEPDENLTAKEYYYSIPAGRITYETGSDETFGREIPSYNGLVFVKKGENMDSTLVVDGSDGSVKHAFDGQAGAVGNKSALYYYVRTGADYFHMEFDEAYNSDFEKITDGGRRFSTISVTSEGYAVLIEDADYDMETRVTDYTKTYTVVDKSGNEVYASPEYSSVLGGVEDWVYVHDGEDINLITWDGEFVYTLVKAGELGSVKYGYQPCGRYESGDYKPGGFEEPFGYYKNKGKADKPEYVYDKGWTGVDGGIYMTITRAGESAGIPGDSAEYVYIPESGKSGVVASEHMDYYKPVLYLYPEEECVVNVTFAHPDRLKTVYPAYNVTTGWNVTAKPDGTLTDEHGRNYYALYWDESGSVTPDWSEGFSVKRENAASFLEEKLAEIGLNWRESNEFIMYWLPYFEKNDYTLVWFEFTKSREAENKLNITPTPDSLLRFSIHLKGSDGDVDLPEQTIPAFEREGFTAVEWGGAYHESH